MNTSDYLVDILKVKRTTMTLDQILEVCAKNEKYLSDNYAMVLLRRSAVKINREMMPSDKGPRLKVVSYEYIAPPVVPQTVPELVTESLGDMFGEMLTRIGFKWVMVLSGIIFLPMIYTAIKLLD